MSRAISVFMPVYNGSGYLQRSLDSLLSQTFGDFEVICVDDSSTDNSYEILAEYASKDERIKIFIKPNGGNVPESWIFALPHMSGKYILYTSQDDFISADLLEKTYHRAEETQADATLPDLVYYYGAGKESTAKKGLFGNRDVILSGREAFLYSLRWDIHAFALWKAELVKSIGFDRTSTNSDEYATRNFYLHSNKVVFSEGTFYYNKENPDAITRKISVKRFDWCATNLRLLQLMRENNFSDREIADFSYTLWGNTVYMDMLLRKHSSELSPSEQLTAKELINRNYAAIDYNNLAKYNGRKGRVIKLMFSNGNALKEVAVGLRMIFNRKQPNL